MVAHFAVMKLGAIVLPLFTLFGEEALRFRLADSGARAAITDDANLDKLMDVAATLDALETVITVDQPRSGCLGLDDILTTNRPLSSAALMAP